MATSKQLYANNIRTSLASGLGTSDTSLYVASGGGSGMPSPTSGQFFLVTLESGDLREIVKVTARSGDVLTITRAQEGTIASSFPVGTIVEGRLTAGTLSGLARLSDRMSELSNLDSLIAPILSDGNSYIIHQNDDSNSVVIAIKDLDYRWSFATHKNVIRSGAAETGSTPTTLVCTASLSSTIGVAATGKYIIQFLSGASAGQARMITSIDSGTSSVSWATALGFAPSVGDTFEIYQSDVSFVPHGGGTALRDVSEFTATAGQTTFAVVYSVGKVDVYRNGRKLPNGAFTATDGNIITLATPALAGDDIRIETFTGYSFGDTSNFRAALDITTVGGETSFSVNHYTPGCIDVLRNGVRLNPVDYVATDGSTITLSGFSALAGDEFTFIIYRPYNIVNNQFVDLVSPQTVYGTKSFDSSPVVPTVSLGDSSTSAASTAFVAKSLQTAGPIISAASGTSDAITASYTPAITALTNGMSLYVRVSSANTTTTPTFTPNSGSIVAKTIVKGAGTALVAGDIAGGGHWIELQYDLTLDKWVLINPAKGVLTSGNYQAITAISGVTTLTAGQSGSFISASGTGYTITLPTPAVGLAFDIYSTGATITIATPSGNIYNGGVAAATFVMPINSTIKLVCIGADWVIAESGSGAASFGTNGYQKLAIGLVLQWGTFSYGNWTASSTPSSNVVTFPIAFPNTCRAVMTSPLLGATSFSITTEGASTTQFTLRYYNNTLSVTGLAIYWTAIGY